MKSRAEYQRAWKKAHPGKHREYYARWYAKNRARVAQVTKSYRARNKELLAAKFKAWRAANLEKFKATNRRCRARHVAALADDYVRWMLIQGTILKPTDIPEPLVAVHREKLKLKRLCRNLQTSTNSV